MDGGEGDQGEEVVILEVKGDGRPKQWGRLAIR